MIPYVINVFRKNLQKFMQDLIGSSLFGLIQHV